MSTTGRRTYIRRSALTVMLTAIAAVSVFGCSQKYTAERDGKDLGEALCDLKDASTPEEAASALADVQSEMDSLASNYAMFTAEDRADIDENLEDLREHVAQGNEALIQQDLTVIRRSLNNVSDDLDDTSQAAWDGVKQGVDECIAD
jgi:hypothetical protein